MPVEIKKEEEKEVKQEKEESKLELKEKVDSGTVSLFALTSDLTNSETVAATL